MFRKKSSSGSAASLSESESAWDEAPDTSRGGRKASARRPAARKTKAKPAAGKKKKRAASSDEQSESDYEYLRQSDRKRGRGEAGQPSYVVPDTDEDVDEETVQSCC